MARPRKIDVEYKTISARLTKETWLAFKLKLAKEEKAAQAIIEPAILKYLATPVKSKSNEMV